MTHGRLDLTPPVSCATPDCNDLSGNTGYCEPCFLLFAKHFIREWLAGVDIDLKDAAWFREALGETISLQQAENFRKRTVDALWGPEVALAYSDGALRDFGRTDVADRCYNRARRAALMSSLPGRIDADGIPTFDDLPPSPTHSTLDEFNVKFCVGTLLVMCLLAFSALHGIL